jgi:membrane associated rhomboid family serine protease
LIKVKKGQVSLVFRLWVLASVFVVPFMDSWEIAAWAALGGALALWWRALPEDPPEPPPRLPYQHLYERPRDKP